VAQDRDRLEQTALRHVQRGHFEKAIESYLALLRMDARDRRVRQRLGELYLKVGRESDGVRHLREVSNQLQREGHSRQAISVLKKLTELLPDDRELVAEMANAYSRAGLPAEAARIYRQAVSMFAAPEARRAIELLQRLIELQPGDLRLRFELADLMESVNEHASAVATYRELATIYFRRGAMSEVVRALEAALDIDPTDTELRVEAVNARIEGGSASVALKLLDGVPAEDAGSLRVLEVTASALLATGNLARARKSFMELARRYEVLGEPESRSQALRGALEAGGEDAALKAMLGSVDAQLARLRRRLDESELFKASDPESEEACIRARVYERYGLLERAEQTLRVQYDAHSDLASGVRLAEVAISAGNTDAAIGLLQTLASTVSGDTQSMIRERISLFSESAEVLGLLDEDELLDDGDALGDLLGSDLVPMEVAPVEVAPVEVAPVEVAPVEVAPVEVAPAEVAPVEVAPAEVAPAETADVLDLGDLDDFTDLTVGDLVASVEAPRSGEDAVWEALLSADPIASPPEAGEGSELEAIEGLLVSGAVDEALAAAQAQEGLGAAILVSRAYAAKGEAKKGLSSLRDAVDEAPEFDPYFVQALFALAELYIANNKLRSALRRLEDIVEADPEWRSRDVRLRIQALKQRLST